MKKKEITAMTIEELIQALDATDDIKHHPSKVTYNNTHRAHLLFYKAMYQTDARACVAVNSDFPTLRLKANNIAWWLTRCAHKLPTFCKIYNEIAFNFEQDSIYIQKAQTNYQRKMDEQIEASACKIVEAHQMASDLVTDMIASLTVANQKHPPDHPHIRALIKNAHDMTKIINNLNIHKQLSNVTENGQAEAITTLAALYAGYHKD